MLKRNAAAKPEDIKSANSLQLTDSINAEEEAAHILTEEQQNYQDDLEARHQALLENQAELEDSRNYYAMLYDAAPVGCVVFDNSGRIIHVNLTAANLIGVERTLLLNMPMYIYIVKSEVKLFFDHLRRCKQTKERVVSEMGLVTKGEKVVQIQLITVPLNCNGGHPSCYVTAVLDITEREQLNRELSRLDRLNTIGEMAAGIAHEVRNPMTTVRGFLQLFNAKDDFSPYAEQFNLMIDELDRANAIITEFLSLARSRPLKLISRNLNDQIESLGPMLQSDALLADNHVEFTLGQIPNFPMDKDEMRQLILNLARNGLQAMSGGGSLAINTYTLGNEVIMAVRDQGQGIDPEVRKRLGTPFFTTKEQGTGIGLAVCYNIAARHNAVIDFDTSPEGSTFYVRFRLQGEP